MFEFFSSTLNLIYGFLAGCWSFLKSIPIDYYKIFLPIIGAAFTLASGVIKFFIRHIRLKSIYTNLIVFTEQKVKLYTENYIQPELSADFVLSVEEGNNNNKIISFKRFQKKILGPTNDERFFIILGESGMGKSALLINLLYNYYSILNSRKGEKFKLFIIDENLIDNINTYKITNNEYSKTILLLDALDEDTFAKENLGKRMDEIEKITQNFKRVIITSRVQFFASEKEEPGPLKIKNPGDGGSFYRYKRLYITPFSEKDVKKYLNKKYGKYNPFTYLKRRKAYKVVTMAPKLMLRPMILSHIDDLIDIKKYTWLNYWHDLTDPIRNEIIRFRFKLSPDYSGNIPDSSREYDFYKYSIDIYEKIVGAWVQREAGRKYADEESQLKFKTELIGFSIAAALFIYESLEKNGNAFITKDEIKNIFNQFKAQQPGQTGLSFETIQEFELTERSLLTRDKAGNWSFSHRSIFEYFLALLIHNQFDSFYPQVNFISLEMCKYFLEELCLRDSTTSFFEKLKDRTDASSFEFGVHNVKNKINISHFSNASVKDIMHFYQNGHYYEKIDTEEFYDYRIFLPLKNLTYSFLCHLGRKYDEQNSPYALKLYNRALDITRDSDTAYHGLYRYFDKNKNYDAALLNLLIAKNKSWGYSCDLNLGDLYFKMEKKELSLFHYKEYYEAYVKSNNDYGLKDCSQYNSYIKCLQKFDLHEEVLEKAKEADKRFNNEHSKFLLAEACFYLKDYSGAIKYYQEGFDLSAAEHHLYRYHEIGNCYHELGDIENAIQSYAYPTTLKPDNRHYWYMLGNFYLKIKMDEKALECYIKPTTTQYADPRSWRTLAEFYLMINKPDLALQACITSAKVKKLSSEDWHELGELYRVDFKEYDKAKEAYEKAIELKNDNAATWNGLGITCAKLKNSDLAISGYLKAIEYAKMKEGMKHIYCCNLANKYAELFDYENAARYALMAKKLNPDHAEAYSILGLLTTGEESFDYHQKAYSLNPANPNYCFNMAVAYFRSENYKEAVNYCNKGLKIDPEYEAMKVLKTGIEQKIKSEDTA